MSASRSSSPARRAWWVTAVLALTLVGAFALPLGSYVITEVVHPAIAQDIDEGDFDEGKNPRANYWRAVREGKEGYTAASGPYTTDVLILNTGEIFRQIRNGPVASIAPWVLAGVLAAIALFHFLVGPQVPENYPSGRKMPRWSFGERMMHWYVATLFFVLAITGLSLLFGRMVLIPVIGLTAFGAYAELAKLLHNVVGPFFIAGVVVEIVVWMRYNLFNRDDVDWLKRAGGMFGGRHPHAGRMNGGEKVWFWFIATFGLFGVGVTGLILDFPNFGQSRETMQLTQIVHAVFAVLWIAISFGHIYLGILGTPGALEGMTRGRVDEEWMKFHHDRWYEKVKREHLEDEAAAGGEARPTEAPRPT